MKFRFSLVIIIFAMTGCFSRAEAEAEQPPEVRGVNLSIDSSDCVDGWLTMDVRVEVETTNGRITRDLDPSCNFTFSDSFTSNGITCRVSSGMCSSFMNRSRIEARCQGRRGPSHSASEGFPCPDED